MPDTRRTLAALQALLADNTTQDISPQDLRDVLISLSPMYAFMHVSSSGPTSVLSTGTYYKAEGTTVLSRASSEFTMPSDNRLTYSGPETVLAAIDVSFTTSASTGSRELAFRLAKNGGTIFDTEIRQQLDSGGNAVATHITYLDDALATSDYWELWLTDEDGTNTVTVDFMNFRMFTRLI